MRFTAFGGALITAFLTISASAKSPGVAVFRSETSVVHLTVTITDQDHHNAPVAHASASDILIYDNSALQHPTIWLEQDPGTDYLLLIDTSLSMSESSDHALNPDIKDAAKKFVQALRQDDRMMIVTFAEQPAHQQDAFTADRATLDGIIDHLTVDGQTKLYQSLYEVLATYIPPFDPERSRRVVLILITDGEDTASIVSDQQALDQAQRSQTLIYSIELNHLGIDEAARERNRIAHDFLEELSRQTGGQNIQVQRDGRLDTPCTRITDELSHQYWLGYQPTTNTPGWHEIKILPLGRNWAIRNRSGYFVRKH